MAKNTAKYIIVGAGLSGLTTAYMLHKQGETDFLILEARSRIGGRIFTKNGVDLGATWFQNYHQYVKDLLTELEVDTFYQYNKGKNILVYNTMAPAHYFENDPIAPSAYRIAGGSSAMIKSLATTSKNAIKTNTVVLEINEYKEGVSIVTSQGNFTAQKAVITIPPRIATRISFTPPLSEKLIEIMGDTHTWMSNAIKVGMTFKTPFWRAKKLSGTVIGQIGAVTELYDHSDIEKNTFALMGFVNEGLREVSATERKTRILEYLKKYIGEEVLDYLTYQEKDWSKDKSTSCDSIKPIYMIPRYGNSKFEDFYIKGRVFFSGTETSPVYGGYMEGAIYSGMRAAKKLLE